MKLIFTAKNIQKGEAPFLVPHSNFETKGNAFLFR